MHRRNSHRSGDHKVIDDRTGFVEWAGDCVKEWNGGLVHRRRFEARHPQDFIRVRREDFHIKDARPERAIADERSVGPLIAEAAAASAIAIVARYAPMGALGQFALGEAEEVTSSATSNGAGSLYISLETSAGMSAADRIGIFLDSGDVHMTTVDSIFDSVTVKIATALPSAVSAGNRVIDYTALTAAQLA